MKPVLYSAQAPQDVYWCQHRPRYNSVRIGWYDACQSLRIENILKWISAGVYHYTDQCSFCSYMPTMSTSQLEMGKITAITQGPKIILQYSNCLFTKESKGTSPALYNPSLRSGGRCSRHLKYNWWFINRAKLPFLLPPKCNLTSSSCFMFTFICSLYHFKTSNLSVTCPPPPAPFPHLSLVTQGSASPALRHNWISFDHGLSSLKVFGVR